MPSDRGKKEAARILELRGQGMTDTDIACDGRLAVGFRWLRDHPDQHPGGELATSGAGTKPSSPARPRGSGSSDEGFPPQFVSSIR